MTAPTREAVEALLALEAKATPRPWYATDKEYALRDDNGETIETEMHDFGDVWTVSTNRDVPGWCTDGG